MKSDISRISYLLFNETLQPTDRPAFLSTACILLSPCCQAQHGRGSRSCHHRYKVLLRGDSPPTPGTSKGSVSLFRSTKFPSTTGRLNVSTRSPPPSSWPAHSFPQQNSSSASRYSATWWDTTDVCLVLTLLCSLERWRSQPGSSQQLLLDVFKFWYPSKF